MVISKEWTPEERLWIINNLTTHLVQDYHNPRRVVDIALTIRLVASASAEFLEANRQSIIEYKPL